VRVPPFSSTFLIYLVFSLVPTFSRKICDQWISKSQRRGRQVKAGRLGMVWCAFKGPQGPQGPQGPGYLEQCGGRTPQPVVTTCWSPCQVLKVHVGAVETIIFGPKEFRFGVVIECVLGSERGWKKKRFRLSILCDVKQLWQPHIPPHQALKVHLGKVCSTAICLWLVIVTPSGVRAPLARYHNMNQYDI